MRQELNRCDNQRIDTFLNGSLDDEVSEILKQHLETCESCRQYLEESAADSQTWTEIGGLLRSDSLDKEDFLTTRSPFSTRDDSNRTNEIIAAMTPSEFPNHLGRIGIYEVTGVVGTGATGVVFKAIDPSLDRKVAIKVLAPALATSGAARKRFERESKAAAAIIHPNVVPIHGVATSENLSYLVMTYVGGESLQNRLVNRGPMKTAEVLRVGFQIASGLAAAHDQGLVHRDIKPANILIEDNVERIAITDFGLARAVDDASITREGTIAGTPRYMSPEQTVGESVNQKSDLFSLGSLLYAISTGRPPFSAESSYVVMRKICEETPTPIRELNPEIPDWLEASIAKLMNKEPAKRFASAQEVADLFETALAHAQQPTQIPLPTELKQLARSRNNPGNKRKVSIMLTTIASIFAAIAALTMAWSNGVFQQDFNSSAKDYPKVALFPGARVQGESGQRQFQVLHENQWCKVLAIADVDDKSLFEFADKHLNEREVNKRLVEDLPVVFQMMEKPLTIPTAVLLAGKDGKPFTVRVTASKENRSRIISNAIRSEPDRGQRSTPERQLRVALFPDAKVKTENGVRQLHVLFQGKWFKVKSIDSVTSDSLFEFADRTVTPNNTNRRIVEDLPVLFMKMEKPLGKITDVVLVTEDDSLLKVKVAATKDNRSRLMHAQRDRPMNFEGLSEDVDSFKAGLQGRFAYLDANGVDLDRACQALLDSHPDGIRPSSLSVALGSILAKYIDGHARVRRIRSTRPPALTPDQVREIASAAELNSELAKLIDGHAGAQHDSSKRPSRALPFLIEPVGDRFVAFFDTRETFVDPKFPYITSIDGLAVRDFIKPLEAMVAKGSPQYRLRHKLRAVRDVEVTRRLLNLKSSSKITVELANDGGETVTKELTVAKKSPTYGTWPPTNESKILDGNIGYLRLPRMSSDAAKVIKERMPEFSATVGLIVDVRDNGGGSREALIELSRHLMKPTDTPRIANVCKYRLHPQHGEDHLASRFAYRADSDAFDDKAKEAVREFAKDFKPEWEPAAEKFSQWHYLVLSNNHAEPTPFYDKPVVILMNQKCFSATDIFLGAFKGWPNVTLVGQPSGGGSAKSEGFSLPNSNCRVRCASMASFQPNGKLYDGNGIHPDVLVEPTPEYFIKGGDDPFLSKAFELLNKPANGK